MMIKTKNYVGSKSRGSLATPSIITKRVSVPISNDEFRQLAIRELAFHIPYSLKAEPLVVYHPQSACADWLDYAKRKSGAGLVQTAPHKRGDPVTIVDLAGSFGDGSAEVISETQEPAPAGLPDRLWLPLLVLDTTGPLRSKALLQSITFLAQHEGKTNEYDFGRHRYGPYSDCLDLDTASYPSLIAYNAGEPYDYQDYKAHHYYKYEITDKGKSVLSSITDKMDCNDIAHAKEAIARISGKPLCELLEAAHGAFTTEKCDYSKLESRIRDDLSKSMPSIRSIFDLYVSEQAITILSVMDTARIMLSEAKTDGDAQRGVVLNLFTELTQKCIDAARAMRPGGGDSTEGPAFAEINDLLYCIIQYCEDRNIARDPATKPLSETLTGDEAKRLAKAFWEYEIPK